MPDPNKQTISATQVPALFNRSPYETRWTLYQRFIGALDWMKEGDGEDQDRMYWGKKLQPAILSAVADKLKIDKVLHENKTDRYMRHPEVPVGCTPDGYMMDPQRGLGWIETKNVDGMIFRDQWTPTSPPDHIVLQHQTQLMVPLNTVQQGGPDRHDFPQWGIVAALVGGNALHLYEFTPDAKLHEKIAAEARTFMEQVRGRNEPEVTGDPIELPEIATVWPDFRNEVLDVRGTDDDDTVATMIAEFMYASQMKTANAKWADGLKARLLGMVRNEYDRIRASGYSFKVTKSPRSAKVYALPDALQKSVGRFLNEYGEIPGGFDHDDLARLVPLLKEVLEWREISGTDGITTRVTAKKIEGEAEATPGVLRDGEE